MKRLVAAAALTLTLALGFTHTAAAATFGNTAVGNIERPAGANYMFGSVFPLTEAGTLTEVRWYCKGGTATQKFRGVPNTFLVFIEKFWKKNQIFPRNWGKPSPRIGTFSINIFFKVNLKRVKKLVPYRQRILGK